MTATKSAVVDNSLAERRRYKRECVEQSGRQFEPVVNREAQCTIIDLSPGGARVQSATVPPPGTPIVIYIDGFGRFEGSVARADEDGFGIQFNCSEHKRERIAEQLAAYRNGGALEETSLRRHTRAPTKRVTRFTRASGEVVTCEALDFSVSGVSLMSDVRPPIGELVLIAEMVGRIARHHESGVSIEFMQPERAKADVVRPNLFATV